MLLIPVAFAMDLCGDTVEPMRQCAVVSPVLSCGVYNYTLLNVTSGAGSVLFNGTASSVGSGLYYFNFTEPSGSYAVVWCDLSTKQISVSGGEFTMLTFAFLFGLLILFSGGMTIYLTNMGHALAYMFLLMTVLFMDMVTWLSAKIATEAGYSWAFIGWRLFWIMLFITLIMFMAVMIHFTTLMGSITDRKEYEKKRKMFGGDFG